jgi:large subunit ribosomal protein L6
MTEELKLKIPEQVKLTVQDSILKATGPKGNLEKKLYHPWLNIIIENEYIIISSKRSKKTRVDNLLLHTYRAHIRNIINGVLYGYIAQLKICSGHFPMNVSIEGNKVIIKNFFGEKIPREAQILKGATVKLEGDIIIVTGLDKDVVGQTAARIEQATSIKNRDRRRFQDGCHIISSAKKNDE